MNTQDTGNMGNFPYLPGSESFLDILFCWIIFAIVLFGLAIFLYCILEIFLNNKIICWANTKASIWLKICHFYQNLSITKHLIICLFMLHKIMSSIPQIYNCIQIKSLKSSKWLSKLITIDYKLLKLIGNHNIIEYCECFLATLIDTFLKRICLFSCQ